jgi:hypothetical protein
VHEFLNAAERSTHGDWYIWRTRKAQAAKVALQIIRAETLAVYSTQSVAHAATNGLLWILQLSRSKSQLVIELI